MALNDIELAIENIQKLCASVQVSHLMICGWRGRAVGEGRLVSPLCAVLQSVQSLVGSHRLVIGFSLI